VDPQDLNISVAPHQRPPICIDRQDAAYARFIKFLSRRFYSLELKVVEIVLDERTDLLVPHASSKAEFYLLLIEGFEVGE
jgi:hypothetical protein